MLNYTVNGLNTAAMAEAEARWDSVAKPLKSLGVLEELITRIAGIQETADVSIRPRCGLIFCADHGVTAQGVSQTDQKVTALVADAIGSGTSNVSLMAAVSGTPVYAVDVGMACETKSPNIIRRKTLSGTADMSLGPAMPREDALRAIQTGIDIVGEMKAGGCRIIALGEMGIGNTTATAALSCVLLGMSIDEAVDRGAGLSDEGLVKKRNAVRRALEINAPDPNDITGALSKVGGLEICALTGAFLGGMTHKVPMIIDGVITEIAALAASRICPECAGFMLASHMGHELPAIRILDELRLKAVIHADLALGEGTGAVALLPLLDMAYGVYSGVHTFEGLGMDAYKEKGGKI